MEQRAAWFSSRHVRKDRTLCAASELAPWTCSIYTESHFLLLCHDSVLLNLFFQHRCSTTPKPKQCHASWERAPLQLMLSKFAFQAFSWHWITLHKCESVFMNPTVTSRVEAKCLFFPEEDSLPTSITNRQLALKPRSESNGAALPPSHAHRWLPSSLLNPFKEERCVFCGSCCDVVVVEINTLF